MRVRVLGGFAVEGVADHALGSRKARQVMKILVLARGAPVSVDRIIDVLWGHDPPARPADQVGVLVSRLRAVVGADRIERSDSGYAARADWLDLDELAMRVREAAEALDAGRIGAARAAARAALALARGPVLPEEDGDWVEADRATAASLVGSARRIEAEAAARAGDHHTAIAAAEEVLAHDPYDEAALRIVMRAHVAAGRPASALAAYVRVRDHLVEDLGVSPTPATEALHDEIVLGDTPQVGETSETRRLFGRAVELAALDDALNRVAQTATSLTVGITGEAGIGKTSLVDHWRERVAGQAMTLVGGCDPLGRDLPLQPILDAIAGHIDALALDERATALEGDGQVLRPLLGVGDGTGRATVVTDPVVGQSLVFAALVAVIGRLAAGRVAVVILDDIQLAGDSTRAWLAFARRRAQRTLFVTTSREPIGDADVLVRLGPLDLAATVEAVGPDRAAELHARTGGHPLLLTALVRDGGDDASDMPSTILEAVSRRVEGLGDAAPTVTAAAVLGGEIDLDLLADVLRVPAATLLAHLETAVEAGLLVERGAGFAFRHELERDALATSAGAPRRALVNRDAARALALRRDADPLAVAVHARLGGDLDLAIESFTRAADVALRRHDVDAAASLIESALALGERPSTLCARARLRMATSQLDDAAEDARRAVDAGGGSEAMELAGWIAYYRRRSNEALALADAASERAATAELRISSLSLSGRVRHGAGQLPEAVADLERAVSLDGPADVRALALVWLAQARAHQGNPAAALALLDRALVDPQRLPHPFAPLHGAFTRVVALGQLGRAEEALAACDAMDDMIARSGEAGERMRGPAANVRAWLLRWTGHTQEADEWNHRGLEAHDPDGVRVEAYYSGMLDLVDGRLLAGDDGDAARILESISGIETWDGTMSWHQRHRWNLLRSRLALRDGDRDTAQSLAVGVAADAAARGAHRYELLATAIDAIAGGAAAHDPARIAAVVEGLERCAALDGRHLVDLLVPLLG